MLEQFLTWVASLRIRLIATYVLVTVISFGALFLLLLEPVGAFILQREEDSLKAIATTLGSTISTPWQHGNDAYFNTPFLLDIKWTQRRIHQLTQDTHTRIRILDDHGELLADSAVPTEGNAWMAERLHLPGYATRKEVQRAVLGLQPDPTFRKAEETASGTDIMYITLPIMRTDPNSGKSRVAFIMYLSKSVDYVERNLFELRKRITIALVASLLVTIIVSMLLAGHLSAGLRSATRITREFAAGHMQQRIRAKGRDEVGQLGLAFNQMADALQRHEQLRRNLLADVSHELRTPLTAIAGYADTLADGALRDDPVAAERFLGVIIRESERLQRLVSDILELSKLQAGAVTISLTPLPLAPLIADAVEIARLHVRHEGVIIECAYPDEPESTPLMVLGNEDRLAQALRNLLDNARHHTPAGKRIIITVDANPNTVAIHIRDEGEGIPAEDLPQVFDRFYRAGKGGTKPGGTGLGLAIVREIIHAHEGQVMVKSEVGDGTTFSLHLPRAQAEAHPEVNVCSSS